MMSKLSSAAQAVLDAYRDADIDDAVNSAAVLRAAADHLCLCWSEELSLRVLGMTLNCLNTSHLIS
jgi:hypothetical protein